MTGLGSISWALLGGFAAGAALQVFMAIISDWKWRS